MLTRRLIAFVFVCSLVAEAQYYTGPRGGCYTISSSGRKRYVDRSMCGSPDPAPVVRQSLAPAPAAAAGSTLAVSPEPSRAASIDEREVGRKLIEWLRRPSASEVERNVKIGLAKELGLRTRIEGQ
ncbi:MAG: hypothetical protein R2729_16830 [Bryobacteraceae bacterium]